jgi:acyl-CoA thioesterase-1
MRRLKLGAIATAAVFVAGLTVAALTVTPAASNSAYLSKPIPTYGMPALEPRTVSFVGDSYTGGSGMNSGVDALWATLLANERGWVRVSATGMAEGGSGFLQPGKEGTRFIDRADRLIEAQPDIVFIAGGFNDLGSHSADEIADAESEFVSTIRAGLPDARLVLLSAFSASRPSSEALELVELGAGIAAGASAQYIDVSTLFEQVDGLIGEDGVHPTDQGHRVIYDYLTSQIADDREVQPAA